jgi:hypothetical protein
MERMIDHAMDMLQTADEIVLTSAMESAIDAITRDVLHDPRELDRVLDRFDTNYAAYTKADATFDRHDARRTDVAAVDAIASVIEDARMHNVLDAIDATALEPIGHQDDRDVAHRSPEDDLANRLERLQTTSSKQ